MTFFLVRAVTLLAAVQLVLAAQAISTSSSSSSDWTPTDTWTATSKKTYNNKVESTEPDINNTDSELNSPDPEINNQEPEVNDPLPDIYNPEAEIINSDPVNYTPDEQVTGSKYYDTEEAYQPKEVVDYTYSKKNVAPITSYYGPTPDPLSNEVHDAYYNNYYNGYYDASAETLDANAGASDSISDKNFEAPPVATAMTGGLPFISYALRGIAWLFCIGTLFLMFVGTVSAAFYRWTKVYVNGTGGRDLNNAGSHFVDIDMIEFVFKSVERWRELNRHY